VFFSAFPSIQAFPLYFPAPFSCKAPAITCFLYPCPLIPNVFPAFLIYPSFPCTSPLPSSLEPRLSFAFFIHPLIPNVFPLSRCTSPLPSPLEARLSLAFFIHPLFPSVFSARPIYPSFPAVLSS
jgi:hypothetical protein